jgi:hypothetical protein
MTVADGIQNLHFSPNESGCGQAGERSRGRALVSKWRESERVSGLGCDLAPHLLKGISHLEFTFPISLLWKQLPGGNVLRKALGKSPPQFHWSRRPDLRRPPARERRTLLRSGQSNEEEDRHAYHGTEPAVSTHTCPFAWEDHAWIQQPAGERSEPASPGSTDSGLAPSRDCLSCCLSQHFLGRALCSKWSEKEQAWGMHTSAAAIARYVCLVSWGMDLSLAPCRLILRKADHINTLLFPVVPTRNLHMPSVTPGPLLHLDGFMCI